jgi:hypothetical protein
MGLRELNTGAQAGFDGAADVLELLAALPAPEEILQLRPAARLAARITELIEKSRSGDGQSRSAAKTRPIRGQCLSATPRFGNLSGYVPAAAVSIVLSQSDSRWRSTKSTT